MLFRSSPATIVRLCKKIGLDGYNEFKIKYSAELQYDYNHSRHIDVNFPFTKDESLHSICHNVATLSQESIYDTMQLIDFETLEKIIDLLEKYQDIDIYGSGNSLLAAMLFEHKMMRIQRTVNIKHLNGEQAFMSYNSNPNRLALIISYSGETQELDKIAEILKEKKTTTVVITSIGDNNISRYADYVLHTGSREKIFKKIAPFASFTSIDYILHIIFAGLFQRNYHENVLNKISYDKKNDARHPIMSPINEEYD